MRLVSRALRPLALTLLIAGCTRVAGRPPAVQAGAPPPVATPTTESPDGGLVSLLVGQLEGQSVAYGRKTRRDPNDICETIDENLNRAEKTITSESRAHVPVAASHPWDRKTPPKYLDIVQRRFSLTTRERAMLARNGFVVPARLTDRTFAGALHEVYQSQLPIYISSDAILHAIYKGNDEVMMASERTLLPRLEAALSAMHQKLREAGPYPPEVRGDLDIYLTVARTLLTDPERSPPDSLAAAQPVIDSALAGKDGLQTVSLFGRARVIDWSQYSPRGHYTNDPDLERYFRGAMWLSRLELNLVSRASRSSQPGIVPDPTETPREAVDAMALADLAERANVLGDLGVIEQMWTEFAGKREDVSLDDLLALRRRAKITDFAIPDSAEKLRAAIGNDFQRTARIHYMPQGSTPLPAIATMLGPRIVPDTQVETNLVHSAVPNRAMPSFADVAFMMGNDRSRSYLGAEIVRYPSLEKALDRGRAELTTIDRGSLYTAWLSAIRDIAPMPSGAVPSFMKTPAYADMKINTTVAAYGQLRHNFVLMAGQGYMEGGCVIPDGYVEPNLALYESLVIYAQRGLAAAKAIGAPKDTLDYFERLAKTLAVLVVVVKDELAGRPLSEEEKRWLSMTSEILPATSEGPGSNDGWYFNMFPQRSDAFGEHAFVADWFTSPDAGSVVYAGAREPRMGLFVVDVNGDPRVMVGPVAHAFEHVGSLDGRLADKDANQIAPIREPWAASYTAADVPFPPLAVIEVSSSGEHSFDYIVRSTRDIGPITVELIDHHRTPMGKRTIDVGPGWKRISLEAPADEWPSKIRVRSGEATRESNVGYGLSAAFGGMKEVEWEAAEKLRQKFEKKPAF